MVTLKYKIIKTEGGKNRSIHRKQYCCYPAIVVKKNFMSLSKSCSCISFVHGFEEAKIIFSSYVRWTACQEERKEQKQKSAGRNSGAHGQSRWLSVSSSNTINKIWWSGKKEATDKTVQHYANVDGLDPSNLIEHGEYSSSRVCTVLKSKYFQGQAEI